MSTRLKAARARVDWTAHVCVCACAHFVVKETGANNVLQELLLQCVLVSMCACACVCLFVLSANMVMTYASILLLHRLRVRVRVRVHVHVDERAKVVPVY